MPLPRENEQDKQQQQKTNKKPSFFSGCLPFLQLTVILKNRWINVCLAISPSNPHY
jgi:hypothetical protein